MRPPILLQDRLLLGFFNLPPAERPFLAAAVIATARVRSPSSLGPEAQVHGCGSRPRRLRDQTPARGAQVNCPAAEIDRSDGETRNPCTTTPIGYPGEIESAGSVRSRTLRRHDASMAHRRSGAGDHGRNSAELCPAACTADSMRIRHGRDASARRVFSEFDLIEFFPALRYP